MPRKKKTDQRLNDDHPKREDKLMPNERSQAGETAAHAREAEWESLMRSTPAIILTTDRDGRILFINRAVSGHTVQGAVGKTAYDFAPAAYHQVLRDAIERVFETGKLAVCEIQGAGPDGAVAWYSTRAGPIWRDGKVDAAILIANDVTDRRRAEDMLARSEAKYRALFESSRDAIMTLFPPDWRFVSANASTVTTFGAKDEAEFTALAPWEVSPERQPDGEASSRKARKMIETAMERGSHFFEWTHRRLNGEAFPATVLLTRVELEGKVGLQATVRDITERKRAEDALRESEDRYRTLFDEARDGIGLADAETGVLIDCNRALCRMVERDRSELQGQSQAILHPPNNFRDGLSRTFRQHQQGDPGLTLEDHLLSKSGNLIPVEIRAAQFQIGGRDVLLGLFRDCTERCRLQEQFLHAQKMESVGRLAGGVAHDFNNMLGVIIGHAELALAQVEPGQVLCNDLQEILKAAERSADFTRQLLAFARRQTISPKVLDLNKTVSCTLKMLQRLIGENIELVWTPGRDVWPVKIDPVQVDQILVNLATNARDAITGTGKLTISTENLVVDSAFSRTHVEALPGEHVVLIVGDTGSGMDKETLRLIFEPFFTTKEAGKGTGLGLPTVYGIVKQNNGFIDVYSEPGRGTVFKIYLPRTEGAPGEEPAAAAGRTAPGGTETVLLVEDEEGILTLARKVLEMHGYTVLAARAPHEALILAENTENPIHLLISDIVMPEMDGRQLRDKIVAIRPGLRTLFMSGYTADVIARHGMLEEGVQFIQKPFAIDAFAAKVRAVLDA
ncbi:MAG: PAS domain S-box protein [Planctomycetota bacterium]|nr:PAS domain S-box protein [Planctomycetota bacterium]